MDWDGCPINFWIWGGMDLDPTLRGGLEWELKICPVKTSSYVHHIIIRVSNVDYLLIMLQHGSPIYFIMGVITQDV